jgi:nicotinamide-nucleotide amidase
MNESLQAMAEDLVARAAREKLTIITAESCTSGLLATVLSEAPGAAKILHGGFVTYTKEHKHVALGVPEELLSAKSAVCEEVACAMAQGALARSTADLAAAITGVAGPEPDEDGNPVGRVYIAAARRGGKVDCFRKDYGAIGRDAVREAAMADAIAALKPLI